MFVMVPHLDPLLLTMIAHTPVTFPPQLEVPRHQKGKGGGM